MKILNLGCGGKPSPHTDVLNIDWSISLRLKKSIIMRRIAPLYLSGERLIEFQTVPDNILVQDVSSGLPFEDNTIDMVYHCHVLEHIDRDKVAGFLLEVKRVLRTGGIHRIVVPDFEPRVKQYASHLKLARENPALRGDHDHYISALLEQSVRKESYGTSQQPSLRRWLENWIFGDARRRGETHQWMYDTVNLSWLLEQAGYSSVHERSYEMSALPHWSEYGLDLSEGGSEYKPESIYLEAVK